MLRKNITEEEISIKIALINGSPKIKGSASESILEIMKTLLNIKDHVLEFNFRKNQLPQGALEELANCDVLVFAFPLYVDGIPAHLLSCLYEIEEYFNKNLQKKVMVYSLVNCGFFEGHQNEIAIEIMKNWCQKSKLIWGQGIGIGGGGMLPSLKNVPEGKGPKKNIGEALNVMAENICEVRSGEDRYVSPNFPRFAYKFGAEMGWRQQIKANGLKVRDLNLKRQS